MADFLILALLAGTGVALITGPLGAFVVWRRMAYFGDTLAHSALLGILSHSSLALGLIAVYLIPDARINLEGILFGDLLTVSAADTLTIWLVGLVVLGLTLWLWHPLLAITVHQDLAQVEGVSVAAVKTVLMLSLALVIAITMKVVGVLLITALLVIPAATARHFAKTPEAMAVMGSVFGLLAVVCGLAASWFMDTPAGPSIVLSAGLFFLLAQIARGNAR